MTGTCAGAAHKKHVPPATTEATTSDPDAWWIPAAFLLPAFIVRAAVAVIEAACNAWADDTEATA